MIMMYRGREDFGELMMESNTKFDEIERLAKCKKEAGKRKAIESFNKTRKKRR
jgi:hypothetical protein